jgi:hydroxyacylglutathione hydrolase
MLNECFVVGLIRTNCYLVACDQTLEAVVIDPGISTQKEIGTLLGAIKKRNLRLKYILNTHHHSDHTAGNSMLKKTTHAEILIHELDALVVHEPWKWWLRMIEADPERPCPVCSKVGSHHLEIFEEQGKAALGCHACGFKIEIIASPPPDRLLHHGDVIHVGESEFTVIHTPGHSPGGASFYLESDNAVFTGDTLFSASIGRTDTVDGSFDDIIKSVKELMKLPEETVVYPGHGEGTTIGKEKRGNPYVRM